MQITLGCDPIVLLIFCMIAIFVYFTIWQDFDN